jgi:hypothetical protein
MPFSIKGLAKIADLAPFADGAPPRTLWAYTSPDAMTTIRVADYFLPAVALLKLWDVLLIQAANGGTVTVHLSYVNANTGTAIDITDGTQVSATDTD